MKKLNIVLYDSFKNKVTDAKIDSLTTFEKIDNLEFMKFELNTQFKDLFELNKLLLCWNAKT